MKKRALLSLCVLLLTGGATVNAEVYELNPVVVTASRVEKKEFDTQANISVITRKELEEKHYSDLGEALKDVPGVNLQNYGASGENYTSNRLYINGSQNIVVLIDGMRANVNGSASNALSPSEYPNTDTIERIEVLKGSSSTLYGADAAGGVINIITKKSKPGIRSSISAITGSYGKRTWKLSNEGESEGWFWNASAYKNKMGNFTDAHGNEVIHYVNSKSYDFLLGKKSDDGSDISLKYSKYKSSYTRPDQGGRLNQKPKSGKKDNDKISLRWNWKINDHLKNHLFIYKNDNVLHDGTNVSKATQWNMDLTTRGITEQLTYEDEYNTLIAGFDFYQDIINDYYSYGAFYSDKKLTNRAWFIQEDFRFAKNWNITPGVRYTSTSHFGNNTSPSITLGYNNKEVNIYGGYREFFIAPGQSHLFTKYGDPNLKPAEGHTVEAGINYAFDDSFTGNFNIYRTKADNMIAYDGTKKKYANIANEKTNGWSVGFRKVFDEHFSGKISYTYTHIPAENAKKNPNRDGYIPEGQVMLGLDYTSGKFSAGISGRGLYNRPGRKVNEDKVPDSMKSFWIFDMALNYRASTNFNAFFKINNLNDKFYTEALYNMIPDDVLNPTNWYSAPGRNFQLGVEYKF